MGLEPAPRTGISASSCSCAHDRVCSCHLTSPTACGSVSGYAPPQVGLSWKAGRFSGQDFALQPDGTLRCPADQKLVLHEQRREVDGSLRVVYGASIHSCRSCLLREQCQWNGSTTKKPRQVSVLLHPLAVGNAPLLWKDWSRRQHRRACIRLHSQRLEIQMVRLCPSPVRNGYIIASHGKSGSLATHEIQPLRSPSKYTASQTPLQPSSDCRAPLHAATKAGRASRQESRENLGLLFRTLTEIAYYCPEPGVNHEQ